MTHIRALLAHFLNFDLATIDKLPYPQVLQYLHAVMLINGNATRWLVEDRESSKRDAEFIQTLDL